MTGTPLIVLPLLDPTCEVVPLAGERVVDLNADFWRRMGDAGETRAAAAALDAPGASPQDGLSCLLAAAAADALTEPPGSPAFLRGLGAAARARSAGDPGLRVSVDDVHLVSGTTEASGDVVRAARVSTLLRPETGKALSLLAAADGARLLVEADQQLPAVFTLLGGADRKRITLTGRFVAAHRDALRQVPGIHPARLTPGSRTVRPGGAWGTAQAFPVSWVARAADIPAGWWAGWLDASEAAGLTAEALERCRGLVISVAAAGSWSSARGAAGTVTSLQDVVSALRGRVPLAVEILAGAPGTGASEARRVAETAARDGIRIAGCRPFRLPVGYPRAAWGGVPVCPARDRENDLARWTSVASDAEADAAAHEVLGWLSERHFLFPGRLAAALFQPDVISPVFGEYGWDTSVRHVSTAHAAPDTRGPGDFLVSLRTGRINRIPAALAGAIRTLRAAGHGQRGPLPGWPAARHDALVAGLKKAGILVRTEMVDDAA